MNQIKVSEHFLSFQGEGSSVGKLSVFVRLQGCKLNCTFCDTAAVWKQGVTTTVPEFFQLMKDKYDAPLLKSAQLVVTGGDPLMQQEALYDLLSSVISRYPWCNVEIETEGVIKPTPKVNGFVHTYNVSPKLSNSGMPLAARYKPDVINWHAGKLEDTVSIFKFVVGSEADVKEALGMINAHKIPRHHTYFMPLAATRAAQDTISAQVAEWAKREVVNFSPRMHLSIWDQATGV